VSKNQVILHFPVDKPLKEDEEKKLMRARMLKVTMRLWYLT